MVAQRAAINRREHARVSGLLGSVMLRRRRSAKEVVCELGREHCKARE